VNWSSPAPPVTCRRLPRPRIRLEQLTDDVAIVGYKVHEELTVGSKPVIIDAADASTYVRRNGKWLCALHTESVAGDPFDRDRTERNALILIGRSHRQSCGLIEPGEAARAPAGHADLDQITEDRLYLLGQAGRSASPRPPTGLFPRR